MMDKQLASIGIAELKYLDGEFVVIKPGAYVVCAVTGKKIPLETLRYWNIDKQEAYIDADAAMIGFRGKGDA